MVLSRFFMLTTTNVFHCAMKDHFSDWDSSKENIVRKAVRMSVQIEFNKLDLNDSLAAKNIYYF